MSKPYININSIVSKVSRQYWNKPGAVGRAMGFLSSSVGGAQREMIKKFEDSLITQELDAGPDAKNISGTISYTEDEGNPNLFTFIGFPEGFNPTFELRNLINTPIRPRYLKSESRGLVFRHDFVVTTPSEDMIYAVTPMPEEWSSGSWVDAVESGNFLITSVKNYLSIKTEKSRSGGGLQVKAQFSSRGFTPRPYILSILNDFNERLLNTVARSRVTI